jgi:alkylhydroperoxidase/carboxymuconolactone decarboxylase family protein YurZ
MAIPADPGVPGAADELTLADIRDVALKLLEGVPDGEPLDPLTRDLVEFGIRLCVTSLDIPGAMEHAARALELGATPDQLQEIVTFVAGVGMHTLMEGTPALARILREHGVALPERTDEGEQMWDQWVGDTPYWATFDEYVPGFLDALVRLSPPAFEGFMQYGSIAARSRQVRSLIKEYIAVGCDATPTHRYLPGVRAHVHNARVVGAGRRALIEVLDLAAAMPLHRGIR